MRCAQHVGGAGGHIPLAQCWGPGLRFPQLEFEFQLKENKWGLSSFQKNAVRYLEPFNIPTWDQQVSRGIKLFLL